MRKNRRRTARKTAKLKKKITFTGISARVMMSCAAALLLLSFLSVVADPAKAWFFTIFGLLFIPLFIVNLILFVWALKRRSKSFVIPVIALLPSIFFIGAYFQFPSSSRPAMPSDEESAVRIVTYNVGRFMQPDKKKVTGGRKACADSVRRFLASQDADIICLQEFYASDLKEVQSFAKGIGKGYRPEYYLFKGRYGYYGNVTFSRMKARDKGVVKFEDSANLAIYTDYSAGGRPFRVYNCHFESYNISMSGILRSVRRQARDALKETEHKMRRGITRRPRQVNQVMDDLETSLASFTDAVSRNDVVGMQTQAENALSKLDSLDSIEAPEELSEVQQSYQDGTAQLREALSSYVALYTEISSATESQPFDWSTYDARLAEIQESYDAGIDALEAGDKAAAEVEGGAQGAASDQQAAGGDQKQDGAAAQ